MNLRYLFLLLTLLWISIAVFAADKNPQESETVKEKITTSPKPGAGKRARVKTLEEFIPSEEVSADKPVAFPNDI